MVLLHLHDTFDNFTLERGPCVVCGVVVEKVEGGVPEPDLQPGVILTYATPEPHPPSVPLPPLFEHPFHGLVIIVRSEVVHPTLGKLGPEPSQLFFRLRDLFVMHDLPSGRSHKGLATKRSLVGQKSGQLSQSPARGQTVGSRLLGPLVVGAVQKLVKGQGTHFHPLIWFVLVSDFDWADGGLESALNGTEVVLDLGCPGFVSGQEDQLRVTPNHAGHNAWNVFPVVPQHPSHRLETWDEEVPDPLPSFRTLLEADVSVDPEVCEGVFQDLPNSSALRVGPSADLIGKISPGEIMVVPPHRAVLIKMGLVNRSFGQDFANEVLIKEV